MTKGKVKVKDLTVDELELLIEQKILEILGDPDYGLQMREDLERKLAIRMADRSDRIAHDEVAGSIR